MIRLYNGFEIPEMGLGTFPYTEELPMVIKTAYDLGYRLIDTSDNYHNEEFVGKALMELGSEKREKMVVCSKYSRPKISMAEALSSSVKKLECGRENAVDIYLMHWPYPHLWKQRWHELEDLYESGKCKAIGVCNFSEKYLYRLLEECRIKPMINQFESHPMFQQQDTVNLCLKEKIQVMSYSPLARMNEKLFNAPLLLELSEKYGRSVSQIILRWNIQTNRLPIPASKNPEHLAHNFDVFGFALDAEEIENINSLECNMRIRLDPDTRFGFREKALFYFHSLKIKSGKI